MTVDQEDDALPLERFQPLKLILNTPKGRGVFAPCSIPSGSVIDVSPVLILHPQRDLTYIEKTSLHHYTYNWPFTTADGQRVTTQAVVFGLGSMFNHSTLEQNVGWKRDLQKEVIIYSTLRDIADGEELCISYGDHLWFADADAEKLKAEAKEEDGEEVLAKIAIDEAHGP